ncbi:MAG: hypothetical protein EXR66_10895 [Dehalococcoidia bacterium]|nr:hypothetical protein [Dehalococcoidia bacterium]
MTDETLRIFDPRGHVLAQTSTLAPRPKSLAGLRPGILENRKPNVRLLLTSVVEAMRERMDLGDLIIEDKPIAGPPSKRVMERLRDCDFVLVGSAD